MKNLQNFEIYIDANGKWFHQGKSIDRVSIVKLFSTILKRDKFGEYWLENPVEKGKIIVEDAPFVIVNFEQKRIKTKNYIFFIDNIDRRHLLSIKFPIVFYKDKSKKFNKPYISLLAVSPKFLSNNSALPPGRLICPGCDFKFFDLFVKKNEIPFFPSNKRIKDADCNELPSSIFFLLISGQNFNNFFSKFL